MAEYTPTTEQVRAAAESDCDWIDPPAFDRYLAAHDAEIREQTLAPIRDALNGHPVCDTRPDGGIPSCGWKRVVADARRALDA